MKLMLLLLLLLLLLSTLQQTLFRRALKTSETIEKFGQQRPRKSFWPMPLKFRKTRRYQKTTKCSIQRSKTKGVHLQQNGHHWKLLPFHFPDYNGFVKKNRISKEGQWHRGAIPANCAYTSLSTELMMEPMLEQDCFLALKKFVAGSLHLKHFGIHF